LIRNDLGRICKYGSVKVPRLFKVEKYESLFQMVSIVQGKLRKNIKMLDVLKNIFPCGSVTGAPKIRTMELIKEIEKEERDIYTGSIGLITPDEVKMNVAIRTITVNKKSGDGTMGLGSGIVWDSEPAKEYEEVLLKSKFLTEPSDYFELFETMRFEKGEVLFVNQHIARLKSASDYFLFKFNEKQLRKQIGKAIADLYYAQRKKIRISLNKWGGINIEISEISKSGAEVSVIVSAKNILSKDKFRQFKTTNRKLYDDEYSYYSSQGLSEVLFLNEKGEVAEGSRTNIFIRKGNKWFTPTLSSGALPGIYRNYFICKQSGIQEKEIKLDELLHSDELLLTNALRGVIRVDKLFINQTEFFSFNK
jgi:para-aminobenzoate synthetase/4-amino-4-deoxychorismate lyase